MYSNLKGFQIRVFDKMIIDIIINIQYLRNERTTLWFVFSGYFPCCPVVFPYSDHSLGRAPGTPRCRPRGRLEKDPGIYGTPSKGKGRQIAFWPLWDRTVHLICITPQCKTQNSPNCPNSSGLNVFFHYFHHTDFYVSVYVLLSLICLIFINTTIIP